MSRPSVYSLRTRDLVNAGQVIDVVLLDDRAREVFESFPQTRTSRACSPVTVCGGPTGAEGAAAIAPQAEVNADSRLTLLEGQETLRQRRAPEQAE